MLPPVFLRSAIRTNLASEAALSTNACRPDRFGPAPETVRHLLDSHKIKILASHANISMVEISGQRLMLTRNGDFILLSNKFPRLASAAPADKLRETLDMLKNI